MVKRQTCWNRKYARYQSCGVAGWDITLRENSFKNHLKSQHTVINIQTERDTQRGEKEKRRERVAI